VNVIAILRQHVRDKPTQPALIDTKNGRTRMLTFAELDRASAQGAALLRTHSIGVGQSVLVFHPMSIELYIALLAIFRVGAIAMFVDPSAGRLHIDRCCALYPPCAFFGSGKAQFLRLASRAIRRIPIKFTTGMPLPGTVSWSRHAALDPLDEIVVCDTATPALLTFTSGSTDEPKCAVRSHEFLLAQHEVLKKCLVPQADDVDMPALPIFVLDNLASGVTSVIADADLTRPGFIEGRPVVEQIHRHSVNRITASPALFERLIEYCEAEHIVLPGLNKIFTGGAPVFPSMLRRLQTVCPNAVLCPTYGSTEAEPIADIAFSDMSPTDMADMFAGRGLLVGKPIPHIELRVMHDQWGTPLPKFSRLELDALTLPVGQVGEIVVCGDHVLRGYLNGRGDAETKMVVDEAVWHRTGDVGYLDPRGRLWLLGRSNAVIRDLEEVIYPFAVECAALTNPAVRRAALAAVNRRRILCVELQPGSALDQDALKRALAWARLDEIKILLHMPVDKRHNSKINYPALRVIVRPKGNYGDVETLHIGSPVDTFLGLP